MTFGALHNEVVGSHTEAQWQWLVRNYGFTCFYCGNPVRPRGKTLYIGGTWVVCDETGVALLPENELTKDHLHPLSRGGVDFLWNIRPTCLRCNRQKGSLTCEEFIIGDPQPVQEQPEESTGKLFVEERGKTLSNDDFVLLSPPHAGICNCPACQIARGEPAHPAPGDVHLLRKLESERERSTWWSKRA